MTRPVFGRDRDPGVVAALQSYPPSRGYPHIKVERVELEEWPAPEAPSRPAQDASRPAGHTETSEPSPSI